MSSTLLLLAMCVVGGLEGMATRAVKRDSLLPLAVPGQAETEDGTEAATLGHLATTIRARSLL